jgi:hypothetical protein
MVYRCVRYTINFTVNLKVWIHMKYLPAGCCSIRFVSHLLGKESRSWGLKLSKNGGPIRMVQSSTSNQPKCGCICLYTYNIWLVVSNIFHFPFHIWDVILPIGYFSKWLKPPTSWQNNATTHLVSELQGEHSAYLDGHASYNNCRTTIPLESNNLALRIANK